MHPTLRQPEVFQGDHGLAFAARCEQAGSSFGASRSIKRSMGSVGESAMDGETATSVGSTEPLRRTLCTNSVGSIIRGREQSKNAAIVTGAKHSVKHLAKRSSL